MTDRPASSWALIHSKVASSLACASSGPWLRHCGHSLWVSASHSGLGRLPAIVVSNMRRLSFCVIGVTVAPDVCGRAVQCPPQYRMPLRAVVLTCLALALLPSHAADTPASL